MVPTIGPTSTAKTTHDNPLSISTVDDVHQFALTDAHAVTVTGKLLMRRGSITNKSNKK